MRGLLFFPFYDNVKPMTKRTRLIILLICVTLFLIIAPYLVLYSLGYRVDFSNQKIVATGGIYIKTEPTGVNITIDQTIKETTGYFYNSVFIQNLTPTIHTVDIKKEGYVDYQKSLVVEEKAVTKLENVILFKKDIAFTALLDVPASIKVAPKDATLSWLNPKDLTETFYVKKNSIYSTKSVLALVKNIPVGILSLSQHMVISPDSQHMAYYTDHDIFLIREDKKIHLYYSSQKITSLFWINNDYLTFSDNEKLIISEIDVRGNINSITLSQTTDEMFFNQQDKKLYLIKNEALLISERLVP